MDDPYEKHCGKLTDHDEHTWLGKTVIFALGAGLMGRREHWCKGWVALDGATRPKGNTRQFDEEKKKRG